MKYVSFEISLIALLPAIALCVYVYIKDKTEKEPIGLLCCLFAGGAALFFPSYFLERTFTSVFDDLFSNYMSFSPEGYLTYSSFPVELAHNALCGFLGFSLVQICLKWMVLYFFTRKNRHFNYLFDGIVYSVFISLGFAATENIHFAFINGWQTLGLRILTSLPVHLFIGIFMGYYYTMWKVRYTANLIESKLLKKGVVDCDRVKSSTPWFISSLVIPFVIQGLYSVMSLCSLDVINPLFCFLIFTLYGCCFVSLEKMASKDCDSNRYICRIISKGHPDLDTAVIEDAVKQNERGEL